MEDGEGGDAGGMAPPADFDVEDFAVQNLDTGEVMQIMDLTTGVGLDHMSVDGDTSLADVSGVEGSLGDDDRLDLVTAAGLPPSDLLREGEPVDLLVAGYADVKEAKSTYTVYIMIVARVTPVEGRPNAWTIFRRYRDVLALHDALKRRGTLEVSASFPKKRWLGSNNDADFLEKRRAGLAAWLTALLSSPSQSSALDVSTASSSSSSNMAAGSAAPPAVFALPEVMHFLTEAADCMPPGLDVAQYNAVMSLARNLAPSPALSGGGTSATSGPRTCPSPVIVQDSTCASSVTSSTSASRGGALGVAHATSAAGDAESATRGGARGGVADAQPPLAPPTPITYHRSAPLHLGGPTAGATTTAGSSHGVAAEAAAAHASSSGVAPLAPAPLAHTIPPPPGSVSIAFPRPNTAHSRTVLAPVQTHVKPVLVPLLPPPTRPAPPGPGGPPPSGVRALGVTRTNGGSADAAGVRKASEAAAPPPPKPRLSLDSFELLKVIGKGSFGKVLLVRKRDATDGKLYAMKVLSKANVVKRKQVEHTITERRVLGYTRHPFIIQLHFAFQTRDKLFLVVDYAGAGELFFHLGRLGRFREHMACFYAAELVLALGHLHKLGIVYRDLKPENVLLDHEGHVKLADFGLSKEGITMSTEGAKSFCGTPEYLAPEVLDRRGHGTAVDWWSLGALVYEMLTGLPPWYTRDRKKLYERLRSAPLEFPEQVSPVARSLISGLLTRDPALRLGARRDAAELMEHAFFAHIDWRELFARRATPPFLPQVRTDAVDTRYFDAQFTDLPPNVHFDDEKASPPASSAMPVAGGGTGSVPPPPAAGLERSMSGTSLPSSLFANFTYEAPSLLAAATRASRGMSISLGFPSSYTPPGMGELSTSPGPSALKRVASGGGVGGASGGVSSPLAAALSLSGVGGGGGGGGDAPTGSLSSRQPGGGGDSGVELAFAATAIAPPPPPHSYASAQAAARPFTASAAYPSPSTARSGLSALFGGGPSHAARPQPPPSAAASTMGGGGGASAGSRAPAPGGAPTRPVAVYGASPAARMHHVAAPVMTTSPLDHSRALHAPLPQPAGSSPYLAAPHAGGGGGSGRGTPTSLSAYGATQSARDVYGGTASRMVSPLAPDASAFASRTGGAATATVSPLYAYSSTTSAPMAGGGAGAPPARGAMPGPMARSGAYAMGGGGGGGGGVLPDIHGGGAARGLSPYTTHSQSYSHFPARR